MGNIKFYYHRTKKKNITVAYTKTDAGIVFTLAQCQKGELFRKKVGRDITSGRLEVHGGLIISNAEVDTSLNENVVGYFSNMSYNRAWDNLRRAGLVPDKKAV